MNPILGLKSNKPKWTEVTLSKCEGQTCTTSEHQNNVLPEKPIYIDY